MGPGSDGPLGAMAGMEPHHMNGSLGNLMQNHSAAENTAWQQCVLTIKTTAVFLGALYVSHVPSHCVVLVVKLPLSVTCEEDSAWNVNIILRYLHVCFIP